MAHSSLPNTYARRYLVCVSGGSPQIITETLYALTVGSPDAPYMPTDLIILTTTAGADRAAQLLGPEGQLARFHRDYPMYPRLTDEQVTLDVIRDENGQELSDINTPEHSEAMASQMMQLLQRLTKDDNCAVHVSLAGGRKTMSFFAGYALSIFGRVQDRLSHVLVDSRYESKRDFWYPTPVSRAIDPGEGRTMLDAKDATVTLTDIPFVALRYLFPDLADLSEGLSYRDVINAIRMVSQQQTELVFDLDACTLTIEPMHLVIRNSFARIARAAWVAWHHQSTGEPVRLDLRQPDKAMTLNYLTFCRDHADPASTEMQNQFQRMDISPEDLSAAAGPDMHRVKPLDNSLLDTPLSELKSAVAERLGHHLAERIMPRPLTEASTRGRVKAWGLPPGVRVTVITQK